MKLLVGLAAVLMIAACSKPPESSAPSSNIEIKVDRLFTHEGCTVYRFLDGGYYHYYSKCDHSSETTSTRTKYCGKSCYITQIENIRSD